MTSAEIAEAVAAYLAAAYPTATVRRAYLPELRANQIEGLLITVAPREYTLARLARDRLEHNRRVDVAIQAHAEPNDIDTIDTLLATTEEIAQKLAAYHPGPTPKTVEIATLFDLEHLSQSHTYTAVIQVTFYN